MNCPRCKEEPIIFKVIETDDAVVRITGEAMKRFGQHPYQVACTNCLDVYTDLHDTEEEAWEEWRDLIKEPNI